MSSDEPTRVTDIMTTPIETIEPEASVAAAAARMRDEGISALLVTTVPSSIVTTTDMLDIVAGGRDPTALTVADVMTESVETVPPSLEVEQAAQMMTTYGISHLPVVEDDYVGMVSSTDIADLKS